MWCLTVSVRVKDFRGVEIEVSSTLYFHVKKRHLDVFKVLGVSDENSFVQAVGKVVRGPNEVYSDGAGTLYYLCKVNDLYVNVIVFKNSIKTVYLLSLRSYRRMRFKKWLFKIY